VRGSKPLTAKNAEKNAEIAKKSLRILSAFSAALLGGLSG
jgi:hypothetical protein